MYGYRPANLKANPGLLVALHYCGGTAQVHSSDTVFFYSILTEAWNTGVLLGLPMEATS